MLQAMGHPNVCVLDGGFPKWTKEGRAVHATDFNASADAFGYKLDANKIKYLDQIKAFAGNEAERNYQLLDARATEAFEAGNIPGAQNVPFSKVFNVETKEMKSADERKAFFEAAGVDLEKDITLTCTGGVSATVLYASLKDIAKGKLSVYDGSWTEFSKYQ